MTDIDFNMIQILFNYHYRRNATDIEHAGEELNWLMKGRKLTLIIELWV